MGLLSSPVVSLASVKENPLSFLPAFLSRAYRLPTLGQPEFFPIFILAASEMSSTRWVLWKCPSLQGLLLAAGETAIAPSLRGQTHLASRRTHTLLGVTPGERTHRLWSAVLFDVNDGHGKPKLLSRLFLPLRSKRPGMGRDFSEV